MKILQILLLISTLLALINCKAKSAQNQKATYFILIDEVQNTAAGIMDTNSVETIYCTDDKTAIETGLEKYYKEVVSIQPRSKDVQPSFPYVLQAKGWAVLDEKGNNVKDRISPTYIDSINDKALERANIKLENHQGQ